VIDIANRSRGVGGNIMAGLDALGNGSALAEYRDDLAAIRREALARMAAEAERPGANAVVGVRFDSAGVGHKMVAVVAYGTAVLIEETWPLQARRQHISVRDVGSSAFAVKRFDECGRSVQEKSVSDPHTYSEHQVSGGFPCHTTVTLQPLVTVLAEEPARPG
jgi:uncharacterized protein YbjQ (UPF0145 family)